MQGFGPYAVTAGTILAVNVDPSTASLYIANDSPYDVFVSFNPTQPSPSSILNQDWIGVVPAFHHIVRPVPGGAQLVTPQGAMTFQGKVWLLPVNTRNPALAQNGTVSGTANLYVEAYLTGEAPPTAYASPRQTDITSQARVIAIPPAPSHGATGLIGISNTTPFTTNYYSAPMDGYLGSSGTIIYPPQSMGSHWDGTGNVSVYLHYLRIDIAFRSGLTAYPKYVQGLFGAATLDNTGAIIGKAPFNKFTLGADNSAPSYVFAPALPNLQVVNPQSNVYYMSFYLDVTAAQAAPVYLFVTFLATADNINTDAVPPIGQNGGVIEKTSTGDGIY